MENEYYLADFLLVTTVSVVMPTSLQTAKKLSFQKSVVYALRREPS